MKSGKWNQNLWVICLVVLGLMIISTSNFAEAEEEKKPERAIVMAAEYPGVEIAKDEDVEVWISEKPKGWQAKIKTYRYTVTGIHVPSGDDKSLTFEADPEEGVKPGEYQFRINARTLDGKFRMSQAVTIKVTADDGNQKSPKV